MDNDEKKLQRKIAIGITAIALLGASFFSGALYGNAHRPVMEKVLGVFGKQPPPQYSSVDFNLFWDVWSRLEEKFVDKSKLDRQKLVFGAISGLVRAANDPYTEFFPPAESKQFQEDIKGSFEGIGAEIGIRKEILTIIAPLKDNPADLAGIKAGDKIYKIDDTVTADLNLEEAVRLIRGEKGTTVRLTIIREGLDKPKEFKIVRDTIKVKVLETAQKPDGVFVIELRHFTEDAALDFRRAVQEFFRSNSKKLVLDLRNNPGGFLTVAVDIASWWLPPGDTVASERFADGSSDVYRSNGYQTLKDVPTVILVNQGSASASEIVAGALRDTRNIKLIGSKTFGKGSVQEVINLPKNSSLKVTIAKWLTPKGTEINGKGLEPDVKVELPAQPKSGEEDKDWVMEKALEVLKGM